MVSLSVLLCCTTRLPDDLDFGLNPVITLCQILWRFTYRCWNTLRNTGIGTTTATSAAMALDAVLSEYADFCPVCSEMAVLRWIDSDLDERICDDCAECLVEAQDLLFRFSLGRPSPELIDRNP